MRKRGNGEAARINGDASQALEFLLAGYALFTVRSRTGTRYTYKIEAPLEEMKDEEQPDLPGMEDEAYKKKRNYDKKIRFVKLLTGRDNTKSYTYLGAIDTDKKAFRLTGKSKMTSDSTPVKAISWLVSKLAAGLVPTTCEIWHEGRCGRCGRPLTVPESVQSGYGPDCIQIIQQRRAA